MRGARNHHPGKLQETERPAGNVDVKLTAKSSTAFHEIVEIALEHVFDIPSRPRQ